VDERATAADVEVTVDVALQLPDRVGVVCAEELRVPPGRGRQRRGDDVPPYRSPPAATSTRSSPAPRWPPRASSSSATASAYAASTPHERRSRNELAPPRVAVHGWSPARV